MDNDEVEDDMIILVCPRVTEPLFMEDNLIGECSVCATPIQFRPDAFTHGEKVCTSCGASMMEAMRDPVRH